jgi:hypothetical protein
MRQILTVLLIFISISLLGCSKKTDIQKSDPVKKLELKKEQLPTQKIKLEEVNEIVSMVVNHKGSDGQSLKETFPYMNSNWYADSQFEEPFFINDNHYKLITTKEYLSKKYENSEINKEIIDALKTQTDFITQMQFYAEQIKEMVEAKGFSQISPVVMIFSSIMKEHIPQIPWANDERIRVIMSNLSMLIKEGNEYYSRAYDIYLFMAQNYSLLKKQLNEPGNSDEEIIQLKKMIKEYYSHKEVAEYHQYFWSNLSVTVLNF